MSKMNILGSGYYVTKTIIKNDDFKEIIETSDEWIKTRTGIEERRYAITESTLDLAYKASLNAINNSKVDLRDIDLVIVATITPDNFTPSVACTLLEKLGIKECMAFDISAACSGFIYAINTAISILSFNKLKKALVIGCEVLSKLIDYKDRGSAILFGDGAGAIVIEEGHNNCDFYCRAKTDIDNVLFARSLSSVNKFENSKLDNHYLTMNGQEVFKFAIVAMNEAITEILNKNKLTMDDIDLIIPHQANERIILSVAKKMNISMDKFYINVNKYGNTSAASIAIAYAECVEKNIIKKGQKIILVGFGAGLTWASMLYEN